MNNDQKLIDLQGEILNLKSQMQMIAYGNRGISYDDLESVERKSATDLKKQAEAIEKRISELFVSVNALANAQAKVEQKIDEKAMSTTKAICEAIGETLSEEKAETNQHIQATLGKVYSDVTLTKAAAIANVTNSAQFLIQSAAFLARGA